MDASAACKYRLLAAMRYYTTPEEMPYTWTGIQHPQPAVRCAVDMRPGTRLSPEDTETLLQSTTQLLDSLQEAHADNDHLRRRLIRALRKLARIGMTPRAILQEMAGWLTPLAACLYGTVLTLGLCLVASAIRLLIHICTG